MNMNSKKISPFSFYLKISYVVFKQNRYLIYFLYILNINNSFLYILNVNIIEETFQLLFIFYKILNVYYKTNMTLND